MVWGSPAARASTNLKLVHFSIDQATHIAHNTWDLGYRRKPILCIFLLIEHKSMTSTGELSSHSSNQGYSTNSTGDFVSCSSPLVSTKEDISKLLFLSEFNNNKKGKK